MRSTVIDRRRFLGLLAGTLTWPMLPSPLRAAPGEPLYLSAHADREGSFLASAFTADGRPSVSLHLPERGHAFAVHPSRPEAVHFARRPGTFAVAMDLTGNDHHIRFSAPDHRHFYGHGVFSPDGRLLYTTENDFNGERGVIGVHDAHDRYRRIGEFSAHGIGPHDIRLLPDGETLVIANGGILTHPDLPRVKLNVPDMRPSLVYLRRRDGQLIRSVQLNPELHQLSIRHLAVGAQGMVAAVMQYEGPRVDPVPLIALHDTPDARLRPVNGPTDILRAMNHYCGSAAFDTTGRVLGVSSPRGHMMTFWNAVTGAHISSFPVQDGCGIAPGKRPGTFLASSGQGDMMEIDAVRADARLLASDFLTANRWDNHIMSMTLPRQNPRPPARSPW